MIVICYGLWHIIVMHHVTHCYILLQECLLSGEKHRLVEVNTNVVTGVTQTTATVTRWRWYCHFAEIQTGMYRAGEMKLRVSSHFRYNFTNLAQASCMQIRWKCPRVDSSLWPIHMKRLNKVLFGWDIKKIYYYCFTCMQYSLTCSKDHLLTKTTFYKSTGV